MTSASPIAHGRFACPFHDIMYKERIDMNDTLPTGLLMDVKRFDRARKRDAVREMGL